MAAVATEATPKKKKKSIFGSLFHRKKSKKKEKTFAIPYTDSTGATANLTQLPRHVTPPAGGDVIQLTDDQSATTNHDVQRNHVPDDVIAAARTNGGLATCSRSSSRSSGFDEISSAMTECSLVPMTAAHAHIDNDYVSKIAAVEAGIEDQQERKREDYDEASSSDTLHTDSTADKSDIKPVVAESCSSQGGGELNTAESEQKLQELSRQIELMSQRFSKMVSRVKAGPELNRSSPSLDQVPEGHELVQQVRGWQSGSLLNCAAVSDARQPSGIAEYRYSRNAAYRRLLETGKAKPSTNQNLNTRQPITATDAPAAMTTVNASASPVTQYALPIGPNGEGDGLVADIPPLEFDDTDNATSEVGRAEIETNSGGPQSTENELHHLGVFEADVSNDAESTSQGKNEQEGFGQEEEGSSRSEDAKTRSDIEDQRSVMSEMVPQEVDEVSATDDQCSISSAAGVASSNVRLSQGHPRSLSSQLSDVFIEDRAPKTWNQAGMSGRNPDRRLLHSCPDPPQGHLRSSVDTFSGEESRSCKPLLPGRALSYESSFTRRRLGQSASCDAVTPRLINRRRSLLEQSAEVKGQFARWHQQFSNSRSQAPSAGYSATGGTHKMSPLKALHPHSVTASPQPAAAADADALSAGTDGDHVTPVLQTDRSSNRSEVTSTGSTAGGWRSLDIRSTSLLADVASSAPQRPLRRLYRSDSLPAGGSTDVPRAREAVCSEHFAIPRTAMARLNADGTPRSILKRTSSYATKENEC